MRAVWLLVVLFVCSCTISTTYVPKGREATLAIDKSQPAIVRRGVTRPLDFSMQGAFACSPDAKGYAMQSASEAKDGQNYLMIGSVLAAFSWLGLIPALIAFPVIAMGQQKIDSAVALSVDAVNIHNDTASCLSE